MKKNSILIFFFFIEKNKLDQFFCFIFLDGGVSEREKEGNEFWPNILELLMEESLNKIPFFMQAVNEMV